MTPVETLRAAARLMRERAQAATPGPWDRAEDVALGRGHEGNFLANWQGEYLRGVGDTGDGAQADADAVHIASWHPAVALAVADWLDRYAGVTDRNPELAPNSPALDVARAYLSEAS